MVEITATAVKSLRERTGLPMMDCKQALVEAAGDQDKAIEILKEKHKKFIPSYKLSENICCRQWYREVVVIPFLMFQTNLI